MNIISIVWPQLLPLPLPIQENCAGFPLSHFARKRGSFSEAEAKWVIQSLLDDGVGPVGVEGRFLDQLQGVQKGSILIKLRLGIPHTRGVPISFSNGGKKLGCSGRERGEQREETWERIWGTRDRLGRSWEWGDRGQEGEGIQLRVSRGPPFQFFPKGTRIKFPFN